MDRGEPVDGCDNTTSRSADDPHSSHTNGFRSWMCLHLLQRQPVSLLPKKPDRLLELDDGDGRFVESLCWIKTVCPQSRHFSGFDLWTVPHCWHRHLIPERNRSKSPIANVDGHLNSLPDNGKGQFNGR